MRNAILPEPAFTLAGSYDLRTSAKRYAAAVSTIRCALACVSAYNAEGPAVVVENMRTTLAKTLYRLEALAGESK